MGSARGLTATADPHGFAPRDDTVTHRCRLCTANDPDGVVEHVAARLWESRDERPWDEAGE